MVGRWQAEIMNPARNRPKLIGIGFGAPSRMALHLLNIPDMHDGVVINDGGGEEDEVEVGVGVELVDVRRAELGLSVPGGGGNENWGQCANHDTITVQPAGSHASLGNLPPF